MVRPCIPSYYSTADKWTTAILWDIFSTYMSMLRHMKRLKIVDTTL